MGTNTADRTAEATETETLLKWHKRPSPIHRADGTPEYFATGPSGYEYVIWRGNVTYNPWEMNLRLRNGGGRVFPTETLKRAKAQCEAAEREKVAVTDEPDPDPQPEGVEWHGPRKIAGTLMTEHATKCGRGRVTVGHGSDRPNIEAWIGREIVGRGFHRVWEAKRYVAVRLAAAEVAEPETDDSTQVRVMELVRPDNGRIEWAVVEGEGTDGVLGWFPSKEPAEELAKEINTAPAQAEPEPAQTFEVWLVTPSGRRKKMVSRHSSKADAHRTVADMLDAYGDEGADYIIDAS